MINGSKVLKLSAIYSIIANMKVKKCRGRMMTSVEEVSTVTMMMVVRGGGPSAQFSTNTRFKHTIKKDTRIFLLSNPLGICKSCTQSVFV